MLPFQVSPWAEFLCLSFSTPLLVCSTVYICDKESIRGGWFAVEQGIRQGWVLAHLLFNIFFVAFINVAYTRFKANKDFMDALVHLRKNTEYTLFFKTKS